MPQLQADSLRTLTQDIFAAAGTPQAEAAIVAEQLVASNLYGLDSHGVVRIPLYVKWIQQGTIKPGAPVTIIHTEGGTAVVDGGSNFGQVGGLRAIEVAIKLAREYHVSCVATRNCRHVGRLGYFTQMAAQAGFFALATVNSAGAGHSVVPFGGLAGRIAPNPISYAVPGPESPVVADMAMSTTSQGKVVIYRNRGHKLPEGWLIDATGKPSTDPEELFKTPRGWILPVGGNLGYKGFAMLLLAEILSGTLPGDDITVSQPDGTNGVCFILVDISVFTPIEHFRAMMGNMAGYMKSAPPAPGHQEVLMPGELDNRIFAQRQREGIPIEPATWQQIVATAQALNVPVDSPA